MTRMERAISETKAGNGRETIIGLRAEIHQLRNELGRCKNSYRAAALTQEINRLNTILAAVQDNF